MREDRSEKMKKVTALQFGETLLEIDVISHGGVESVVVFGASGENHVADAVPGAEIGAENADVVFLND